MKLISLLLFIAITVLYFAKSGHTFATTADTFKSKLFGTENKSKRSYHYNPFYKRAWKLNATEQTFLPRPPNAKKKKKFTPNQFDVDKKLSNNKKQFSKLNKLSKNYEQVLKQFEILALDCEMVGVGRSGRRSILARCSVVRLICDDNYDVTDSDTTAASNDKIQDSNPSQNGLSEKIDEGGVNKFKTYKLLGQPVKVETVYDVFVKPTENVTDYRTKYSGVTSYNLDPSNYDDKGFSTSSSDDRLVSLEECRKVVSRILRGNIIVGHDLANDFDVLKLLHPHDLVRDTALHYTMGRRKQKLARLSSSILKWDIQGSSDGHSSVEDATAALLLYLKRQDKWERSIGYPLWKLMKSRVLNGDLSFSTLIVDDIKRPQWEGVHLYLDGCNLPVSLRQVEEGGNKKWCLFSKNSNNDKQTSGDDDDKLLKDWIPVFHTLISSSNNPNISNVTIMFDGASFKESKSSALTTESSIIKVTDYLSIEISDKNVTVDDLLLEKVSQSASLPTIGHDADVLIVEMHEVIKSLSDCPSLISGVVDEIDNDTMQEFYVLKRVEGGNRIHKKVFSKYNLKRLNEGALCLTGLTSKLRRNSLAIAKDIKNSGGHKFIQCQRLRRSSLREVVVTDDILLADRLTRNGGAVLNFKQFQQII